MIKITEMIQVFKLLIIYFLTLLFLGSSFADDVYQADKNILIISAVDVGDTTFTDVSVQVQDVVSIGTSSTPNTNDIYNSATNQLTIQSVTVRSSVYKNVVVTVGKVIAVGGSQAKYQAKKLSLSSYKNSKELDFFSTDFPKDPYGYNFLNATAYTFFKYPDGSQGILNSELKYNVNTETITTATRTVLTFWKKIKTNWIKSPIQINYKVPTCIHSRKILVSDFNNDGSVDFAIMCHGWDASPFPGELAAILLSQPDGSYNHEALSTDVGFWHGGASEDFNGDGFPDIALTHTIQSPSTKYGFTVYINDGKGKFTKSNEYIIPNFTKAFHIELVDVNSDGKFDVLAGGHDWEESSKIMINPGNNNFENAQQITIPAIKGAGVLTDFVYSKTNNSIYICRTGDGQNNGTVFYEGLWLQKYDLTTKASTTLLSNSGWIDNRFPFPHKWLAWMKEDSGFIKSNWGEAIKIKIE
jgi:FG-GAP-like repeat